MFLLRQCVQSCPLHAQRDGVCAFRAALVRGDGRPLPSAPSEGPYISPAPVRSESPPSQPACNWVMRGQAAERSQLSLLQPQHPAFPSVHRHQSRQRQDAGFSAPSERKSYGSACSPKKRGLRACKVSESNDDEDRKVLWDVIG